MKYLLFILYVVGHSHLNGYFPPELNDSKKLYMCATCMYESIALTTEVIYVYCWESENADKQKGDKNLQ